MTPRPRGALTPWILLLLYAVVLRAPHPARAYVPPLSGASPRRPGPPPDSPPDVVDGEVDDGGSRQPARIQCASGRRYASADPATAAYNRSLRRTLLDGGGGAAAARALEAAVTSRARAPIDNGPRPDTVSFNVVLHAWATSGAGQTGARRAERVLSRMEGLNSVGVCDCAPDTVSLNTVMNAWARSGDSERGPERCEEIFAELIRSGGAGGGRRRRQHVGPDTIGANTVINSWLKSGRDDAAVSADAVLRWMEVQSAGPKPRFDVRPNANSYDMVLGTWSVSGLEGAAHRAEETLGKMLEARGRGDEDGTHLRPSARTYAAVMNAWARSNEPDAAERCEELLGRMATDGQDGPLRPCAACHVASIKAWARSPSDAKAQMAAAALERMPAPRNVYAYNTVVNACAFYYGKETSVTMDVAEQTFKALLSDKRCRPNGASYCAMMKAIFHLTDASEHRDRRLGVLFDDACKRGVVDDVLLGAVGQVCPSLMEILFLQFGDEGSDVDSKGRKRKKTGNQRSTQRRVWVKALPKSWSQNKFRDRHDKKKRKL